MDKNQYNSDYGNQQIPAEQVNRPGYAQKQPSEHINWPSQGANLPEVTPNLPASAPNLPASSPNLPENSDWQNQQEYQNQYQGQGYQDQYQGQYYQDRYQGQDWNQENYNYPTIECKSATIGFWSIVFPSVFALAFGFVGVLVPLGAASVEKDLRVMLFCIPFALVAIGSAAVVAVRLRRYYKAKYQGKRISGQVCGYMNDNVTMNGAPAQIVKILLDTPVGKRYILYKLGSPQQPYEIGSWVDLMVSGEYFLICKNTERIEW